MLLTTDFEIVLLYNMHLHVLEQNGFVMFSISVLRSSSVLLKAETVNENGPVFILNGKTMRLLSVII